MFSHKEDMSCSKHRLKVLTQTKWHLLNHQHTSKQLPECPILAPTTFLPS